MQTLLALIDNNTDQIVYLPVPEDVTCATRLSVLMGTATSARLTPAQTAALISEKTAGRAWTADGCDVATTSSSSSSSSSSTRPPISTTSLPPATSSTSSNPTSTSTRPAFVSNLRADTDDGTDGYTESPGATTSSSSSSSSTISSTVDPGGQGSSTSTAPTTFGATLVTPSNPNFFTMGVEWLNGRARPVILAQPARDNGESLYIFTDGQEPISELPLTYDYFPGDTARFYLVTGRSSNPFVAPFDKKADIVIYFGNPPQGGAV